MPDISNFTTPGWYRVTTEEVGLVVPIRLFFERMVPEKACRFSSNYNCMYFFDACLYAQEANVLAGYLTSIGAYPELATVAKTKDAGTTWDPL